MTNPRKSAFPQADLSRYGIGFSENGVAGMTLREYLAGQALVGLAGTLTPAGIWDMAYLSGQPSTFLAQAAVLLADKTIEQLGDE